LATKPVPPRPVPRLYLATPEVDDPAALVASLPGLLAGADIAAVLLRLKSTDQRTMISRIKALAPAIQDGGRRSCSTAMSNWSPAPAPMARI
jgi:thiamine-phosphate pyrophosphorylase